MAFAVLELRRRKRSSSNIAMGTGDRAFLVLRRQGVQSKFDIAAIARELATLQTGDPTRSVLFDWSQVDIWPFGAPPAAALQAWSKTAPLIQRAAFVHDPKLNRHAAILSALLRVSNVEARSFHLSDIDRAIAWLESDPQEASP
jgi:hypothetical protein